MGGGNTPAVARDEDDQDGIREGLKRVAERLARRVKNESIGSATGNASH
jgi:hypothetical protein